MAPGSLASSLQTEVDDNEGSPQALPLEYVALPGGTPPCQSQRWVMGSRMARVEIMAHSDLDKHLIR